MLLGQQNRLHSWVVNWLPSGVFVKIFRVEAKRSLSCLEKQICTKTRLRSQIYSNSKLAGLFQQIHPSAENIITPKSLLLRLIMKYPLNTEQREEVLSPEDIQSMTLSQKALSSYRNFSLSVSISVSSAGRYSSTFYLALWDMHNL